MSYLERLHPGDTELLESLRDYAKKNDVPIITKAGARFLRQLIALRGARRILEIGTAIGHTTALMAMQPSVVEVTTIERNASMIALAKDTFARSGLASAITLIEDDALSVDTSKIGRVDLIFLDGAKAQNIKFFEKYESLLSPGGVIVADNALFHGLHEETIQSRNLKQLVRKIDAFNHYALNRDDYDSALHPVGDGMLVSIKRG